MESMTKIYTCKPQWIQPQSARRFYELRSDQDLFATLDFKSAWGSLATAVTMGETWSFKRVGFFNTRVTVRKEGEPKDLAVYRPQWTGTEGTVRFNSGASFDWKSANFWATQYGFYTREGVSILVFQTGS